LFNSFVTGVDKKAEVKNCLRIYRTDNFTLLSFSLVTKALDAETKTEAVYLKTEVEAQGSWPILLTVLSLPNR